MVRPSDVSGAPIASDRLAAGDAHLAVRDKLRDALLGEPLRTRRAEDIRGQIAGLAGIVRLPGARSPAAGMAASGDERVA